MVSASALVAVGVAVAVVPASEHGVLDASSNPAGTVFGASVLGRSALRPSARHFGHMPIILTAYSGLPAANAWTTGPAAVSNSAVIVTFTAPPAQILAGADKVGLSRFFDAAPAGRRVYYAYDGGPEGGVRTGRFTAAQYRGAWAQIVKLAAEANNPELKPTLILRASDLRSGSGVHWRSFLPGSHIISTLAWDAYPAGTRLDHDPQLTPPAKFMGPAVAASKQAGLPFGFAGFALATASGRPTWLKQVADYLMGSGALFGVLTSLPAVPATELTDHASIVAWREVVAASGTNQPLPLGPPTVTPSPTPSLSTTPTPTPSPTATSTSPSPAPSVTSTSPSPAPSATSTAPAPPPPPKGAACVTSDKQGQCGPYSDPQIKGTTAASLIGNNVWNPIPGWAQTLYVTSPGNWRVTANMPAGNTAVLSYPSLGANFGKVTNAPTPLSAFASIYSSFSENMNATARTSGWAAYDIWLGQGTSTSWSHEVMIQHDFAGAGPCPFAATASFGGSGGVPVQTWHLCQYGSELIWKLAGNEQSGTVDVLAMLTWLVNHGYLPHDAGLWLVGYGWEICSTGGANENFQLNNFAISATRAS
jgi:hypothetical protein